MIAPQELIERITAAADYEDCIVIVEAKTQANLRWASSTLTTNGVIAEQTVTVIAFVSVDGGIATGSITKTSIEQALGGLPEGDPVAKVNKVFRLTGETYMRTENPRGELGFYLVGDGGPLPYRLKIRAPSFSNLSVLPYLVRGLNISDTVCVLGSLDIVMGEIDR